LGDRYHGFFVAYDQVKDGTPLLRCMAVKKEDTLNFNFSEIVHAFIQEEKEKFGEMIARV
uniref:hypothetical protein n=1 Tax=Enterocloster clostridioformis TaxID=1531 RepID=UPI0025A5EF27